MKRLMDGILRHHERSPRVPECGTDVIVSGDRQAFPGSLSSLRNPSSPFPTSDPLHTAVRFFDEEAPDC